MLLRKNGVQAVAEPLQTRGLLRQGVNSPSQSQSVPKALGQGTGQQDVMGFNNNYVLSCIIHPNLAQTCYHQIPRRTPREEAASEVSVCGSVRYCSGDSEGPETQRAQRLPGTCTPLLTGQDCTLGSAASVKATVLFPPFPQHALGRFKLPARRCSSSLIAQVTLRSWCLSAAVQRRYF